MDKQQVRETAIAMFTSAYDADPDTLTAQLLSLTDGATEDEGCENIAEVGMAAERLMTVLYVTHMMHHAGGLSDPGANSLANSLLDSLGLSTENGVEPGTDTKA